MSLVEATRIAPDGRRPPSPIPLREGDAQGSSTPHSEWDDGAMANVATAEPVPPNGGYAWVCTFAVFLINANTWGINSVRGPASASS